MSKRAIRQPITFAYTSPAETIYDPSLGFFFFMFKRSVFSTISLNSNIRSAHLASFGFERGGSFNLTVSGGNISSLVLFFLNQQEMRDLTMDSFDHDRICTTDILKFSKIYRFTKESYTMFTWNETIDYDISLTPFIVNCQDKRSDIVITIRYKNPNDYTDSREKGCAQLLRLLSYIYPIVSLFWFCNTLVYSQISTDIHHFFTFLPLFKAGLLYLESTLVERRSVYGSVDDADHIASLFAAAFVYSSVMILSGCGASGYCTYRESISSNEISQYVFSSISFIISFIISQQTTSMRIYISMMVLAMVSLLIYLQQLFSALYQATKLWWNARDRFLLLKLEMAHGFGKNFVISGALLFTLNAASLKYGWSTFARTIIIESCVMVLFIIHQVYFLYRKQYIPSIIDLRPEPDQTIRPKFPDHKITFIREPRSHWLSLTKRSTIK